MDHRSAATVDSAAIKAFLEDGIKEELDRTDVRVSEMSDGRKTVKFIWMQHEGRPEFFDNVRERIEQLKTEGYVLFYEGTRNGDSELTDREARQLRKFMGHSPSSSSRSDALKSLGDLGKDYVVQDNSHYMNLVNTKDFNVDVTDKLMIQAYEARYGKIVLTDEDLDKPLEMDLSDDSILPYLNTKFIIVDYRNKYLADKVHTAEHAKIVILYGLGHKFGLLRELKKIDPAWREILSTEP